MERADWITRSKKKEKNQETENLDAVSGGMHSLMGSILNGRWQQKGSNSESPVR